MKLKEQDVFAGRYRLLRRIGSGGFSVVWLAADQMTEDSNIALKIYAPEKGMDPSGLKLFRREYANVLNLHHSHILTARHFDIYQGSPFLVMTFCSGGSLGKLILEMEEIKEIDIIKIVGHISSALDYLHLNEILHQDIKPDNVLIDENNDYLLTDFGISSRLRNTLRKSTIGNASLTVAYASPERFLGSAKAVPGSDIFSLGVMIFELASGDVPWMGAGGAVLRPESPTLDLPKVYSSELEDLMRNCLRYNPEERPTAKEVLRKIEKIQNRIDFSHNSNRETYKDNIDDDFNESKAMHKSSERDLASTVKVPQKPVSKDEIVGGIIDDMVRIEGGDFMMGSKDKEKGSTENEKPIHQVSLDDFQIGRYPVTQKQWKAVMGSNPSFFTRSDNCPVENISWIDVHKFISELNMITKYQFRLPTEAEWEYAAMAKETFRFSGSNLIDEAGWYQGNSSERTHPVGEKIPNNYGLHDMSGNVWEWCSDWYDPYYYSQFIAKNPKGPTFGTKRVLRGGSWFNFKGLCRVSFRFNHIPRKGQRYIGFRLACSNPGYSGAS